MSERACSCMGLRMCVCTHVLMYVCWSAFRIFREFVLKIESWCDMSASELKVLMALHILPCCKTGALLNKQLVECFISMGPPVYQLVSFCT